MKKNALELALWKFQDQLSSARKALPGDEGVEAARRLHDRAEDAYSKGRIKRASDLLADAVSKLGEALEAAGTQERQTA